MMVIKPKSSKQIIYFDVDDTLIFECLPEEKDSFLLQNEDGFFYYKAHLKHVEEIKRLYNEGHQIVIWTHHQLGAVWAERVALALGLDKIEKEGCGEIICMPKPDRFYDDVPAEEIFHPSIRYYLSKN